MPCAYFRLFCVGFGQARCACPDGQSSCCFSALIWGLYFASTFTWMNVSVLDSSIYFFYLIVLTFKFFRHQEWHPLCSGQSHRRFIRLLPHVTCGLSESDIAWECHATGFVHHTGKPAGCRGSESSLGQCWVSVIALPVSCRTWDRVLGAVDDIVLPQTWAVTRGCP